MFSAGMNEIQLYSTIDAHVHLVSAENPLGTGQCPVLMPKEKPHANAMRLTAATGGSLHTALTLAHLQRAPAVRLIP